MTEITSLTAVGAAPATNDVVLVVDVSDTTQSANGTTKKLTVANLIDAVEANANTFTEAVTVNTTTTTALAVQRSAVSRFGVSTSATSTEVSVASFDNGSNAGPRFAAYRNTNASTPAAGHILLQSIAASSSNLRIWPDTSGNLRIGAVDPTNANDTGGTVVGTQTSWHELKENIVEWDGAEALEAINALTLYSYQMIEDGQKNTDGSKPTYKGIVIQDEDRTANAWFGLGYADNQLPVLNDRNLFGYMLAAIQQLSATVEALQAQVNALQG